MADDGVLTHRRTRAGDSFEKGITPKTPAHRRRSRTTEDRCPGPTTRPDGMQRMTSQHENTTPQPGDDAFEGYRKDLDDAERKVAGEIDPGVRAMVVAVAVLVLVGTLALPHAGVANGWDVLAYNQDAETERIALFSRLFVWFVVIFGIGFSMLALVTRRWSLAWVAVAGSAVASALGMMAVWSRQTIPAGFNVAGPSIGLIIGWFGRRVLDVPLAQGGLDTKPTFSSLPRSNAGSLRPKPRSIRNGTSADTAGRPVQSTRQRRLTPFGVSRRFCCLYSSSSITR